MWILCSMVRNVMVTPGVSGALGATYCGRSSLPAVLWQITQASKLRRPKPWNSTSWWQL
jgi:hypothetical protein